MPEIGTSGSMSGDGKRAIGKASSTAVILDSTPLAASPKSAESGTIRDITARAMPLNYPV